MKRASKNDTAVTEQNSQIVIYKSPTGEAKIDVRFDGDTVWLTQDAIAELFEKGRSTVAEHIQNIYAEGELAESSVCREFRRTGADGKEYLVKYYNLELIIAVGYRVKSRQGTAFRQWATARLTEYMVKGFTMDDARLKGVGGGDYWKELLDRIRDIRSSEKALYRQVLDLYATSVDYDPRSTVSVHFFKVVQNKLHYATNQMTAAETVYERADATKDFMGLTTFAGAVPTLKDTDIAKNYLTSDELYRLNRLVSAFFELAEIKAQERTTMRMKDWVSELDTFAKNYGKGVLVSAGNISHEDAAEKARAEYRKYQAKTLTPVEEAYLESIKYIQKKVEKEVRPTSKRK
jgi:hypothetical protein